MKSIFLKLCILIIVCRLSRCNSDPFHNPVYNEATIYDFIENDPFFEILQPESLQYTYRLRQAKDFGTRFRYLQRGVRMVLTDPEECCSSLHNSDSVYGAVALVNRGQCSFVSKAIAAEEAGAMAVIVSDMNSENDSLFLDMVADGTERKPNIPAYFLLGRNGHMIRQTLLSQHIEEAIINIPVNLTDVPIIKLNQPPWIVW
uniref:PRADC1-like protein n=1 Tax=Hirondellea gigas TaxID=1518452 RepID=A0A2P2I472_9CRUS